MRAVAELNTSYEQALEEAKDKQSTLENLLSTWQKYEFVNINLTYLVIILIHMKMQKYIKK